MRSRRRHSAHKGVAPVRLCFLLLLAASENSLPQSPHLTSTLRSGWATGGKSQAARPFCTQGRQAIPSNFLSVFSCVSVCGMQITELNTRLLTARVPQELVEKLEAAAQASDRSRSAELRMALREHLEPKEEDE